MKPAKRTFDGRDCTVDSMDIYPNDISPLVRTPVLHAQRFLGGDPIGALASEAGKETPWNNSLAAIGIVGFALGVFIETCLLGQTSWGTFTLFGSLGAIGGMGSAYAIGRRSIRRWKSGTPGKKITELEISFACKKETDPLRQDYLGIVRTVIGLPQPPDGVTVQSIKQTLRLLGDAIEGLPSLAAENLLLDPRALSEEAHVLSDKAGQEADAVIAASLQRQAAALTRQADTIARTATLVRRNQALRAEVGAQVKAFQTSLAAGQVNGIQDTADLAALADHVALIAQETNALADARSELDTALVLPMRVGEAKSPQAIHAGGN